MCNAGPECEGCFFEGEARNAHAEAERLHRERDEARRELESVKKAYCLLRRDLLSAQEENSRLKRELEQMERQAPAAGQEAVRPYLDFVARLRRTMGTAPDLLAQEG